MVKLYGNLWKKTTLYGNALHCTEIGGKKTSMYGNVRNCTQIGEKKLCTEMCGNQIWFELASQLDLNCSENVKKYCKKVELKFKTKDNHMQIKYSRR